MHVELGSVIADFARKEFLKDGKPLSLTAKEAELLREGRDDAPQHIVTLRGEGYRIER